MAFKAEDGTGIAGANSYISVATFVSFWADRGKDYSDTEAELITAALVNATDYVELRWADKFVGRRASDTQGLSWPRTRAYDRNGIELTGVPTALKNAISEYAKRALDADLAPDPTLDPNVRQKTETVGPISETTIYAGGPAVEKWRSYPKADTWLRQLCTQLGGGTFR